MCTPCSNNIAKIIVAVVTFNIINYLGRYKVVTESLRSRYGKNGSL